MTLSISESRSGSKGLLYFWRDGKLVGKGKDRYKVRTKTRKFLVHFHVHPGVRSVVKFTFQISSCADLDYLFLKIEN